MREFIAESLITKRSSFAKLKSNFWLNTLYIVILYSVILDLLKNSNF